MRSNTWHSRRGQCSCAGSERPRCLLIILIKGIGQYEGEMTLERADTSAAIEFRSRGAGKKGRNPCIRGVRVTAEITESTSRCR